MRLALRCSSDAGFLSVHLPADELPRPAVVGAAHDLLDLAPALLVPEDGGVELRLLPRAGQALDELLAALADRLAHHLVHLGIEESTARLREYVFARAFFAPPDRSPIDRLLAELDEEDGLLAGGPGSEEE